MKKFFFFISIILVISFIIFINYFNANIMKPEDFKNSKPILKIEKYSNTPCMGWTHIQPAEPITIGYRFSLYGI